MRCLAITIASLEFLHIDSVLAVLPATMAIGCRHSGVEWFTLWLSTHLKSLSECRALDSRMLSSPWDVPVWTNMHA